MKTKARQRFRISAPVNIALICVKPRLNPQWTIQLLKYWFCATSSPRDLLRAYSSAWLENTVLAEI